MRRGGALIVALWIIAVLSVMVFSFAYEAHQQAGINVFVRERNRVKRLIEPGRLVGETILTGYQDVKAWEQSENAADLDEEDRFYLEKRDLKKGQCTIGPLLLDEEDECSGTVTIEIAPANAPSGGSGSSSTNAASASAVAGLPSDGSGGCININELFAGEAGKTDATKTGESGGAASSGDANYAMRWKLILMLSGVSEETEVEVPNPDGHGTTRHNLMNLLIASWNDWRDPDDSVTKGPLDNCDPEADDGAEKEYYDKLNERLEDDARGKAGRNAAKEEFLTPRNGAIPDLKELQYIRGFRDFPAVLRGGLLHDADDPEMEEDPIANPRLTGIMNLFCTSGDAKLFVNNCTESQLLTIPGVLDTEALEDGDVQGEDWEEARSLATAIVNARFEKPRDWDSDEVDEDADHWDYKDLADLKQRVEDYDGTEVGGKVVDLGSIDLNEAFEEISPYLTFTIDPATTVFRMTIRAESMGMKHEAVAECYVKDKKVRYVSWRED